MRDKRQLEFINTVLILTDSNMVVFINLQAYGVTRFEIITAD